MITNLVFLAQAAATAWMVGLIWFVQVVHYPLFARVGPAEASAYSREHQRLTTRVVAVPMLFELAGALWLLWDRPAAMPLTWAAAGAVLVALIWTSTAALQVPCHRRLERGFDPVIHRRLVAGNWVRTLAWSARGVILLAVLWRMM